MNSHVPLKKKTLRGNKAPFMTNELRKEIYIRSKSEIKYNRSPTEENKAIYEKQRNKCVSLPSKYDKGVFQQCEKKLVSKLPSGKKF